MNSFLENINIRDNKLCSIFHELVCCCALCFSRQKFKEIKFMEGPVCNKYPPIVQNNVVSTISTHYTNVAVRKGVINVSHLELLATSSPT